MPKVWLITGSSRGLGRRIVDAVLANGHNLVATALPSEIGLLSDVAAKHDKQMCVVPLDVNDFAAAQLAVTRAIAAFGSLDVVVNNAGYGNIGSIEDTSLEEIRAQIETNLFGTIYVTKAAIPIMREQRFGHFIQVSSAGGRAGSHGRAAYSAAKFGVEGFSEVLAKEMALFGVKVTIIEPGGFRTDFAGASTTIREGRPEYDSVVGAVARFQRDFNGKQPGDPVKAAQVVVRLAELKEPPLRLLLGSDAFNLIQKSDEAKIAADLQWRDLSISTDFEVEGNPLTYPCSKSEAGSD